MAVLILLLFNYLFIYHILIIIHSHSISITLNSSHFISLLPLSPNQFAEGVKEWRSEYMEYKNVWVYGNKNEQYTIHLYIQSKTILFVNSDITYNAFQSFSYFSVYQS